MLKTINADAMSRPHPNSHYLDVRKSLVNENEEISIMVQAYKNIEKTRMCIENLLKYTNRDFELVLLDNGTPESDLLECFDSIEYEKKTIVRMTKNITGVYAVDKLLHQVKSKYLVIIPNDVIVTENWLDNLIVCAESDDSIGMVCSVSTNVSNLQAEYLGGFGSYEEMQEKAEAFNVSNPLLWEERIRLIPTATLYRREIFDVVGVYDLGFMHDFGDDDFSFRVRRAGYKLMVCRDTFVHHDHDQTALPQERQEIMLQSRQFFKEKFHGIDAWDDTTNFILEPLKVVNFTDKSPKSILVLDVKCGTPLLDVKNHLRKQGISVSSAKAYTSDAKYLPDLQSISDEVVCGDIEQTIYKEKGQYDVIVLGAGLNYYNSPTELIKTLAYLRKENGYIIFPLRNTNDIVAFWDSLGYIVGRDNKYPRYLHYNDVFNVLAPLGVKNGNVHCNLHNLSEEVVGKLKTIVNSMPIESNKNEVAYKFMINEYWITAY